MLPKIKTMFIKFIQSALQYKYTCKHNKLHSHLLRILIATFLTYFTGYIIRFADVILCNT